MSAPSSWVSLLQELSRGRTGVLASPECDLCRTDGSHRDRISQSPADRNPFALEIVPPTGACCPPSSTTFHQRPLSVGSHQGLHARIGMVPLSAFARTEEGFETGRKAFRLTLGGTDAAPVLLGKTRRVLIDLNRLVAEEAAHYSRNSFPVRLPLTPSDGTASEWRALEERIRSAVPLEFRRTYPPLRNGTPLAGMERPLLETFLPERLHIYRQRYYDTRGAGTGGPPGRARR
jgi:hypothetical protein